MCSITFLQPGQIIFLIHSIAFLSISPGPSWPSSPLRSSCFTHIQWIPSPAHSMPVVGSVSWFKLFFSLECSFPFHHIKGIVYPLGCSVTVTSLRKCSWIHFPALVYCPSSELLQCLWQSPQLFIWHFQKTRHSGFRLCWFSWPRRRLHSHTDWPCYGHVVGVQ